MNTIRSKMAYFWAFLVTALMVGNAAAVPSAFTTDITAAGTQILEDAGIAITAALSVAVVVYGVRRVWGVFKGIK